MMDPLVPKINKDPRVPKVDRNSILCIGILDGEECKFGINTMLKRNYAIRLTIFQIIVSISGLLLYVVRKSKGENMISVSCNQYNITHISILGDAWITLYVKISNHLACIHHDVYNRHFLCV